MTKKELESMYELAVGNITDCASRIQDNINLIDSSLKTEKNIEKKKLLSGLRNEFLYLQKMLLLPDNEERN